LPNIHFVDVFVSTIESDRNLREALKLANSEEVALAQGTCLVMEVARVLYS
jgi:hypothetical protein